ncbi:MAG TPA: DUF4402 domain-containing protein [Bacteroidales bacterium]|nr:DUF4402 domain-containing protein [Bacteroidales bacterium]HRZ48944.1 DUF4402 domain-containing protein [Bacteroidales bacterium]
MKKAIVLLSALLFMVIFTETIMAQNTANTTAQTSAYIVTPIAIQKTVDLNFGKIVPSTTAGTVVVTPAGARNFTGGAQVFLNDQTFAAAEFTVTGEANATYSITINNSSFTVTNGANSMTVNTISTSPTPTGTLSAGGTQTLSVGATLNVDANQAAGQYSNTNSLQITVAYN